MINQLKQKIKEFLLAIDCVDHVAIQRELNRELIESISKINNGGNQMRAENRRGIDVVYHRHSSNYYIWYKCSNKGRFYRMEC